ncbi:MAG: substrate-binding domain-containing protein [Mycetocola sp.]
MMFSTKRQAFRLTTLVALVAVTGLLGACAGSSAPPRESAEPTSSISPEWAAVVDAAEQEGQVVVYNVLDEAQMARYVEAFNAVYPGIEVVAERGGAELYARFDQEIANKTSGADVIIRTESPWFEQNAANLLEIDGPNTAKYPSDSVWADGKAFATAYVPQGTIVWNTNIFPDGFKTWTDIPKKAKPGQYGVRDSGGKIQGATVQYYQFLEDKFGPELLDDLGALDPKIYPGGGPMVQAIGAGEIGVADNLTPSFALGLKEQGAPIDYVDPEGTGFANVFIMAATAYSAHPNASRLFVDFVTTFEGQEAFTGGGFGASAIEGAGTLDLDKFTLYDPTLLTPEVIAEWNAKFAQLFY